MENYYDGTPQGVVARRTREFKEQGFDVEVITFTNQGKNLDERLSERDEFEKWIKEAESRGYKREGVPLSMDRNASVQIMIKKKE